jgi:hypothetical protein
MLSALRILIIMKLLLYFLFVYVTYRVIRRLLFGPKPNRRVYMNWGNGSQSGRSPFEQQRPNESAEYDSSNPPVGKFGSTHPKSSNTNRLRNVQDADFEEIKP